MKVLTQKPTARSPEDHTCQSCKEQRLYAELKPRKLKRVPIGLFASNKLFQKDMPLRICTYCDGSLFEILEERFNASSQSL